MSDVFISYARSTEPLAQRIEASLIRQGFSVWRDQQLPFHRPYPKVIDEQLRAAKVVVVVWSADAVASDWVRAEADLARQQHKLVQVTADGVLPPIPFNQIQCGELKGWKGDDQNDDWRKLVASVQQLMATEKRHSPARVVDQFTRGRRKHGVG